MSEPMTKLLALEITAELWRWLEQHPDQPKIHWPRWSEMPKCANHCACCQYVAENADYEGFPCASFNPLIEGTSFEGELDQQIHDETLSKCPLKSLWPKGCEDPDSVYQTWDNSSDRRIRVKAAREIAEAAEKEISKLLKQQQKGKT